MKFKHSNLVALLLCVVDPVHVVLSLVVFVSGLTEEEDDHDLEGEGGGEVEAQRRRDQGSLWQQSVHHSCPTECCLGSQSGP